MGLIVKPNIKVDKIEIYADEKNKNAQDSILNTAGYVTPIIKINEYVIAYSEIISFELKVTLNDIPRFFISVDDSNYAIRKTLQKQDIDKCVIFFGYKNWYIKFNGIIANSSSGAGDTVININGELFNDKLFNSVQKSYKDKSVSDILKDIAEKTSMGLFTFENNDLSKTIDYCLNTNTKYIEFLDFVIKKYTNNFWCIDPLYNIFVGNFESIKKQKLDKYTIGEGGVQHAEKDMLITTNKLNEPDNFKLKAEYYSINTNLSGVHKDNCKTYSIYGAKATQPKVLVSNEKIGISDDSENTFDGFLNHINPFYFNRVNKDIGGKSITVVMENSLLEILPFSLVDFEVFFPKKDKESLEKDIENSGKKIVIGYGYIYEKASQEVTFPKIKQTLDLI